MSELDGEAAVWVVLDVHDFSVVGQDEKLTTSEVREEDKTQTPRGFVDFKRYLRKRYVSLNYTTQERDHWEDAPNEKISPDLRTYIYDFQNKCK